MKEITSPPAIVHNETAAIQALFQQNVVPSYGRFPIALSHGSGSYVYDVAGKRYLDLGGGIAVCALGHANPEMTEAMVRQSQKLIHVSNLYYNEPQGRLAQALVRLTGPGKVNASIDLPVPDKIVSNLVSSVAVEAGAINITFGNRASGLLKGKTLTLRPGVVEDSPIVPVAWVCGFAPVPGNMTAKGENKTNIDPSYLPLACRAK